MEVLHWTCNDVAAWIESVGFPHYKVGYHNMTVIYYINNISTVIYYSWRMELENNNTYTGHTTKTMAPMGSPHVKVSE